jgi:SAM-dependent methyltransferase
MTGEYWFFRNTAKVRTIDAYDISEGQREKFFGRSNLDPSIEVNYTILDVNKISLPKNTYDVVYIQQAYHHLQEIEHVAEQINKALKPNGIFVLTDYIGANYLQRTEKQRRICSELWPLLPVRLRTSAQNRVYDKIHIPKKETLPPFEAVRAEEILPVLCNTFETKYMFTYAGILFPLLEGFAQNYTDSDEDQKLLQHLWNLDRQYIEEGRVEPNFVRAIFTRKKRGLLASLFRR